MSSLLLYQHILLQHNIKQCNAHGTYTLLQQQSLSHTHYSRIWDKSLHNQRWEYCCERIANNLQLFLFLEFIFFFSSFFLFFFLVHLGWIWHFQGAVCEDAMTAFGELLHYVRQIPELWKKGLSVTCMAHTHCQGKRERLWQMRSFLS